MNSYYKIEKEYVITTTNKEIVDDTWKQYILGEEPKELLDAILIMSNNENLTIKISEAKAYLNSTDWYYARKAETGEDVPVEVVAKRQEAREFIRNNK